MMSIHIRIATQLMDRNEGHHNSVLLSSLERRLDLAHGAALGTNRQLHAYAARLKEVCSELLCAEVALLAVQLRLRYAMRREQAV